MSIHVNVNGISVELEDGSRALEAAKAVRAEVEPAQERVDQATASLTAAIAGLVRYSAEQTPPTDETPAKSGCRGSIGALPLVLTLALAPTVIKKKKK